MQMMFNQRSQIGICIPHENGFGAEPDAARIAGLDANLFASKQNLGADPPDHRRDWLRLQALQIFLQPPAVSLDERPGFKMVATPRNCHPRGPVRAQAQKIAARPWISDHQQRNGFGTHQERFI